MDPIQAGSFGGSLAPTLPARLPTLDPKIQSAVKDATKIHLFSDEQKMWDTMKSDGVNDEEATTLVKQMRTKILGSNEGMTPDQFQKAHSTLSQMQNDGLSLKEAAQTLQSYRNHLSNQPQPIFKDQHADEGVIKQTAIAIPRAIGDTAGQIWHGIGDSFLNAGAMVTRGANDIYGAIGSDQYSPELNADIKNTTGSSGYFGDVTGVTKNASQVAFNASKAPLSIGLNIAAEAPGTQYVMQGLGALIDKASTGLGGVVGLDENTSRNIGQTGMNILGMKGPGANTVKYAQNIKNAYSGIERPGVFNGGVLPAVGEALREPLGAVKDVAMMPYNAVKGIDGALTGLGEKFAGVKENGSKKVSETVTGIDQATTKGIQANPYFSEYWNELTGKAKSEGGVIDPKLVATEFTGRNADAFTKKVEDANTNLSENGPVYEAIRSMPERQDFTSYTQAYSNAIKEKGLAFDENGAIYRPDGTNSVKVTDADLKSINQVWKNLIADSKRGQGSLSTGDILNNRRSASDYVNYNTPDFSKGGETVIKSMRAALDAIAKERIKGLREIDANYVDKLEVIKQLEDGMVYKVGEKKGQFKDNMDAYIKNINTDRNTSLRERLAELMPDLVERQAAISMLEGMWKKYTNPSRLSEKIIGGAAGTAGGFMGGFGGAFLGWIAGNAVGKVLTIAQQKAMNKIISETSDAGIQKLYEINKKIEENIDLKKADTDFIENLKKEVEVEIQRQQSEGKMKSDKVNANNRLGAPTENYKGSKNTAPIAGKKGDAEIIRDSKQELKSPLGRPTSNESKSNTKPLGDPVSKIPKEIESSPIKFYRGEGVSGGKGQYSTLGKGLYSSEILEKASQYGKVRELRSEEMPKNPIIIQGYAGVFKIMQEAADKGISFENYIMSKGYDGAQVIERGKIEEQVTYKRTPLGKPTNKE